jgi:hypothetical protein
LTASFLNEAISNLTSEDITINKQFGVTTDCLTNMIENYICMKNSGREFSIREFAKKYESANVWHFYNGKTVENIIPLLDKIYDNLHFDKCDDLNLRKTKINEFIRIIIEIGLFDQINDNIPDTTTFEDDVIGKIDSTDFLKTVDTLLVDENMKTILYERFGLNGCEPEDLYDISKKHNMTTEKTRKIEAQALRLLRRNEEVGEFSKNL